MSTIKSTSSPESEKVIRDFLYAHYSGVLATADSAGNPHAATVYFTVDDNLCLTFATKTETQKYRNMEENNHVAFVCSDEENQTAVQITGRIEKVTDPEEHQTMLNSMYRFSERMSKVELPPIEKLFAGDYITLRIVPQFIKMGIFMRPDAQSNEELYETIAFESK